MNEPAFDPEMIAPCGINCSICRGYLRQKNPCHGCNFAEENRPKTREHCPLRVCDKREGRFCYACPEFPCDRLKRLDKRYRTRYGMSEIENLKYIRDNGLDEFLEEERMKWVSEEGILCVHDRKYYPLSIRERFEKQR